MIWACADVQGARCAHLPIGRYRGAYLLQHFGLDRIAVIDVPPPLTVFIHTTYVGEHLINDKHFCMCADAGPYSGTDFASRRPADMVMSDATLRPGLARFDDIDVVIDESTWGKHEAVVAVMPGRWTCPLAVGATPPSSFCDLFNAGERLARLNVVRFRMCCTIPARVGWPSRLLTTCMYLRHMLVGTTVRFIRRHDAQRRNYGLIPAW